LRKIDIPLILSQTSELAWVGESAKAELANSSSLHLYKSGELIFQGEDPPTELMIIIDGSAQSMLVKKNTESLERIYYELQVLGLDTLFKFNPQHRMIVADGPTLLLSISVARVAEILSACQDTKEVYNDLLEHYGAYHFIRNSTFLGELLSPRFLIKFVSYFENRQYKNEQAVFEQGDDPDGFYLCHQGMLKAQVIHEGKVVFSAPLKAGDYFGELALTTASKRSASITSEGDSYCYYLSKTKFNSLVEHEPRLLEGFQLLAKLAYGN
jgi:CRP-like cAMP-binding protein